MSGPGQYIRNSDHAPALKRTLDPPIAVIARIDWAQDGPEVINTVALAWSGRMVQVVMIDDRHNGPTVWIPASDVKRRKP